jgi:hypothetical protein
VRRDWLEEAVEMKTRRRNGLLWIRVGLYSFLAIFMVVYARKVIQV